MNAPRARITPKDGMYDSRTVTVELEFPSGEWLDITDVTALIEQLHDEDDIPWGSAKITLYANTDLPLDGGPVVIDADPRLCRQP